MQKIIPHLWFDKKAKEAATFYAETFGGESRVDHVSTISGTPSGDCDIVSFTILGTSFMAISAGPYFNPNPSISFMVNFDPSRMPDARERIDAVWAKLVSGGKVLMPLDRYPFSDRYGWIQDQYGFSWQLILTDPKGEERPPVIPSLLFVTDTGDQAEEATNFYLSVFQNGRRGTIARYPAGMEPDKGGAKEGAVMFTDLMLEGQWFAAMDGTSAMHKFAFNEAISFVVRCDDQQEIDHYWGKLSAVPESEQCGWLKDKFGVSWQIVPRVMDEMMGSGDKEALGRVTKAFLAMKKFDIHALQEAHDGSGAMK